MNMQSLQRAKRQWECVADSMPQFICLLDREGRGSALRAQTLYTSAI